MGPVPLDLPDLPDIDADAASGEPAVPTHWDAPAPGPGRLRRVAPEQPEIPTLTWPESAARQLVRRARRLWSVGSWQAATRLLEQAADQRAQDGSLNNAHNVRFALGLSLRFADPAGAYRNLCAALDLEEAMRMSAIGSDQRISVGRLTDGSGQTAADSSGSGQSGTLSGGVAWSTAHGGSSAFDGSSGQIAASGPVVDTSAGFTVSTWAYVPAGAPTGAALSEDQTNISGFILWYNAGDDTWRFGMPASDSTGWDIDEVIPSAKAATGVWTQLTAVYDHRAGTETLYVNGTAVGSVAHNPVSAAAGPFVAGRDQVNGHANAYWSGGLQDVRAFDYAFTPAEVRNLATGLAAPTGTVTIPAAAAFAGDTGPGDPGCHTNAPYGTVPTLTPALSATVLDADPSKPVHADFGIWDDTDSSQPQPITMGGPGSASASVTGAGTVSVIVPTLVPGHLYGWHARTDDGSATGPTSAVCHFYAAAG